MKLYTPAFDRALKEGVRRKIRRDPKLQKEYRRSKDRRRPVWLHWFGRLVFSWILAALVSRVLELSHHADTALAVLVLWTLGGTTFLSLLLAPVKYQGPDVTALRSLPVSDRTIYDFRRDKVLTTYLLMLFYILAGLGTLAWLLGLPWLGWLGLAVVAGLTWGYSIALAMFIAAKIPRFIPGAVCLGLILLAAFCWFGNKFYGAEMVAALDSAAPTLNLALPTGWPLQFFHWFAGGAWWLPLPGLIPMAAIIWSYRACENAVSARYTYKEQAEREAADQIPEPMARAGVQADRPVGVTTITEGILSGDCFALPRWDEDWVQRALWRWFTPRERNLASVVFPRQVAMVRPWVRILRHLFYATVVWQLTRLLAPPYETLALLFGMLLPFGEVLMQSWPSGAAFRTIRTFGVRISILAPYPIGFREITGLLLKCAAIQLPMTTAIAVGFSVLFYATHDLPWLDGLLFGLRVTLVLAALRLSTLIFFFAAMSNDTTRSFLRGVAAIVIGAAEICLFVALAGLALFLPFELYAWACGIILIATQYGFLRFYGWLWNRGTIDLMSTDAR